MKVEIAGESLILTPERAAFWPARQSLLVADAHFGKSASFRARGVPVPESTTQGTLAVLDALLSRHEVRRIVFLGDFLHSREAHAHRGRVWRALCSLGERAKSRGPGGSITMRHRDAPHRSTTQAPRPGRRGKSR